jgi:hypothetical protein
MFRDWDFATSVHFPQTSVGFQRSQDGEDFLFFCRKC